MSTAPIIHSDTNFCLVARFLVRREDKVDEMTLALLC